MRRDRRNEFPSPFSRLSSHMKAPSRMLFAAALALGLAATLPRLEAQERGLDILVKKATGQTDLDLGKQYAVIIGIDAYKEWQSLRSAVAEARQVKSVLERRYWIDEFIELYDTEASASNIRKLFVDSLPAKLENRDSLLVFYAGHGYTDKTKTGFWIASDGTKDIYDQRGWISNQQLRNMIGGLRAQRILVMADACFAGDFLDTKRGPPVQIDSAYYRNALELTARQVLTSGSSESVPDESEFGRQLVAILERNTEPLLDPNQMYDRIKLGISKTQPLLGTIPGNEAGANFVLFLKAPTDPAIGPVVKAPQQVVVSATYGSVVVNAAESGTLYLNGSALVELRAGAKKRLDNLETGRNHLEMRYAGGANEALEVQVEEGALINASFSWKPATSGGPLPAVLPAVIGDMVLVKGGTFMMGSTDGGTDEKPVHEVRIADFYIRKYEVTVAEFRQFVSATGYKTTAEKEGGGDVYASGSWGSKSDASWKNPYFLQMDREPVVLVSWNDCVEYCNWRSMKDGLRPAYTISGTSVAVDWAADGYRLPTEAEWEYAAGGGSLGRSGGTTVKYAWGNGNPDGNVADERAKKQFTGWTIFVGYDDGYVFTAPVGSYKPNSLGLYDMSGNVWEWCWDWYDSGYYAKSASADPRGGSSGGSRVLRGGGWGDAPGIARVAGRNRVAPSYRVADCGFRLVRSPQFGTGK